MYWHTTVELKEEQSIRDAEERERRRQIQEEEQRRKEEERRRIEREEIERAQNAAVFENTEIP